MSALIRCQRQRLGRYAAIGLGFSLLPALVGAAILLFAPAGMFAWAGATICFLFAFLFFYPTLRMFQWIETDGLVIRGKRLFTRQLIERGVEVLAEIRVTLAQLAEQGRDPALGAIRAYNYQFLFRDRMFMFLSCLDTNSADPFVERVLADPGIGLRLPVVLGGAHLGGFVQFEEAEMGRSYAYFGHGHLAVTIYIYEAPDGMPDGIEDPRLRDEFSDVQTIVTEIGRETDRPTPRVVESMMTLGETPVAPPALCATFEIELGNEIAESRLYLTAFRGHYIKMRCTMPASYRSTWGPELSHVEAALGQLLRPVGKEIR